MKYTSVDRMRRREKQKARRSEAISDAEIEAMREAQQE